MISTLNAQSHRLLEMIIWSPPTRSLFSKLKVCSRANSPPIFKAKCWAPSFPLKRRRRTSRFHSRKRRSKRCKGAHLQSKVEGWAGFLVWIKRSRGAVSMFLSKKLKFLRKVYKKWLTNWGKTLRNWKAWSLHLLSSLLWRLWLNFLNILIYDSNLYIIKPLL